MSVIDSHADKRALTNTRTLIRADGHHNAKARSRQLSLLPSASWPCRVQRLICPPPTTITPPPTPSPPRISSISVGRRLKEEIISLCFNKYVAWRWMNGIWTASTVGQFGPSRNQASDETPQPGCSHSAAKFSHLNVFQVVFFIYLFFYLYNLFIFFLKKGMMMNLNRSWGT